MMSTGQTSYSQKADTKGSHSRVLVGISGGIHSAVTAALLKTQGHEVVGLYIDAKIQESLASAPNHCVNGNTRASAEKIANKLGIDLQVVDASEIYQLKVVEEIVHATARGFQPNPCVPCNREFRLATLLKKAKDLRCEKIATGHGAQVIDDPRHGLFHLLAASDPERDQSFFLFTLAQAELSKLLLPLGNFPRAMVARLATEHGFDGMAPNSQSICYSGGLSPAMKSFFDSKIPATLRPRGVIRTTENQVLGEHQGLYRYPLGEPPLLENTTQETENLIVVGKNMTDQALILGTPESIRKKDCVVTRTNWLRPMNELKGLRCLARLKSNGALYPCQLTFFENQTVQAELDERQGPLFPGQAIVFYQENEVLGGGWVSITS